jgi:hypothetical protein
MIMMLVAGILGGGVNTLQARKADEPLPKSKGYYFILSIAASFSVPLFLSLTKSELLKNVLSTEAPLKAEDWFILFAVCLVAAIYAQMFLESVSKKLLARVDQVEDKVDNTQVTANEALNKAEAAGERSLNPTDDAAGQRRFTMAIAAATQVSAADPEKQKILEALKNSKYSLGRRTLGGIALETKLRRQTVSAVLNQLIADGAVQKVAGEVSGTDYYELSPPPAQ